MKKISVIKKTTILVFSFLVLCSSYALAQDRGERMEKIKAQRIAFITSHLDLTPAEAQAFWPLYNDYDQKQHNLMHETRKTMMIDKKKIDDLPEKEASDLIDAQFVVGQKMLDLRKEYNSKFKTVLPAKKVLLLYDAEREFQRTLIDRLGHNSKVPDAK